jgi:hypothetical protein
MQEEDSKYDNEIFIDADAGFSSEKNSFENLILRQILECTKVLSREMTGGQVIHKTDKTGASEKYIEDVRELVINHVDTLKMLMSSYVENKNLDRLGVIIKEIEDYRNKMLETRTIIPGKGEVKFKDIKGIHVEHPLWKEFINFKAQKYREVFEILVGTYNDRRAYLRSLEEE